MGNYPGAASAASAAYYLPGAPTDDFWNQRMTPAALLGLNAGAPGHRAAGHALPTSSHAGGDHASVPWDPDSPLFWLVLVGGLTAFGIVGASVNVRAWKAHASAGLGKP